MDVKSSVNQTPRSTVCLHNSVTYLGVHLVLCRFGNPIQICRKWRKVLK